ncbi:hypothetical protein [Lichenibacterium dinghuense]|uniref:hypothetical protein n=1 Tax=Lichenibacterium dinghuense TaxID=2895977 RepID=UPI001F1F68B7|nr:hypothetical protein [Lichenibacterium sp. 6Y81]
MTTVVEDRVLARIALEAVAWNGSAHPAVLGDIARGQAATALRVLGIAATPEIVQAVAEDIADIIADPDRLARARASAPHRGDRAAQPGCRLAA